MLCPICKSELVITGQAKLETLDEHVTQCEVSMKDKYECVAEGCPSIGKFFWDLTGGLYCSDYEAHREHDNIPFIDNNDAPFGSSRRQINVEVDKKDENWVIYEGKKWKFVRIYHYQADTDGNILKRRGSIEIWRRDGSGWILHISGIRMLLFTIKQFHRHLKDYKENNDSFTTRRLKEDLTELPDWKKKDWWRRWGHIYKVFYVKWIARGIAGCMKEL